MGKQDPHTEETPSCAGLPSLTMSLTCPRLVLGLGVGDREITSGLESAFESRGEAVPPQEAGLIRKERGEILQSC